MTATIVDLAIKLHTAITNTRDTLRRRNAYARHKRAERHLMANVRIIQRGHIGHAIREHIRNNPPTEPIDTWIDTLLGVIESASSATPQKPKTLMEIFANETWTQ